MGIGNRVWIQRFGGIPEPIDEMSAEAMLKMLADDLVAHDVKEELAKELSKTPYRHVPRERYADWLPEHGFR
jgi:hypothetical protein